MPDAILREEGSTHEDRTAVLDARITRLLSAVRLAYLQDREGLVAKRTNWSNVLSLGEQQRLGRWQGLGSGLMMYGPKLLL